MLFILVWLPKVSFSQIQTYDSLFNVSDSAFDNSVNINHRCDKIQKQMQQTEDYLKEIMKAFDIKKPDDLKLEK